MRSFYEFLEEKTLAEGVFDPKKHYDEFDPDLDDEDTERDHPVALRYPKHKLGHEVGRLPPGKKAGPGFGMSIKTPEELTSHDVTTEKMPDEDLYRTLQAKLHAGEHLSDDERMWLALLSRKSIRQKVKHGIFDRSPLSDD